MLRADITLAKCHGHYILCFWQLRGCITKKLSRSCWKTVSMNCGCLFLSSVSQLQARSKRCLIGPAIMKLSAGGLGAGSHYPVRLKAQPCHPNAWYNILKL